MEAKSTEHHPETNRSISGSSDGHDVKEATNKAGVTKEVSHLEQAAAIDPLFERDTIRKIDLRLVPILSALYAFSLIDRTNLGLIRVAGADAALKLSVGQRYSIVTLIFFVPYIIFELPANIYIRKTGVRVFLSTICLLWGAITLSAGFVKTWQQLAAIRALLGLLEAGYFPACTYIISLWYTRRQVQTRLAAFYLFSVLAGGFSPILAYGLSQMHGKGGKAGWSWIFIIEGLITMVLAIVAYFVVVDFPDKNTFLTQAQTEFIRKRIEDDRGDATFDPLTWTKFMQYVKDLKLWGFALCFMCSTMPSYAISFFLPVILRGMNYGVRDSQLLCAPPYVVTVVYALICSVWSDKWGRRAPFLLFNCVLSTIGLVMMSYTFKTSTRYGGVFLALMGCTGNVPGVLAYQANNIVGQSKRAYSSALTISFGGIGGIFASLVYRQVDAPNYRPGIIATICCQCVMISIVLATSAWFWMRNKQVREGRGRLIEGREGFYYML